MRSPDVVTEVVYVSHDRRYITAAGKTIAVDDLLSKKANASILESVQYLHIVSYRLFKRPKSSMSDIKSFLAVSFMKAYRKAQNVQ
jgi:hypothetical protein